MPDQEAPGIRTKLMQERAHEDRIDKLRRLNRMMDLKRAEISTLGLELEALQSLHTDLTYLEEN